MKNLSRTLGLIAIFILILIEQSNWKYSSPILPNILIILIFGSLTFEVYSRIKTKEKKVITIWTSSILLIGLITIMVKTYTLFKADFLIVNNRQNWELENYKVKYYEHIFKRPSNLKQSYHLYQFGYFKTLYKEIDAISFKDTIDRKLIEFPKTGIRFNKEILKVNLP